MGTNAYCHYDTLLYSNRSDPWLSSFKHFSSSHLFRSTFLVTLPVLSVKLSWTWLPWISWSRARSSSSSDHLNVHISVCTKESKLSDEDYSHPSHSPTDRHSIFYSYYHFLQCSFHRLLPLHRIILQPTISIRRIYMRTALLGES